MWEPKLELDPLFITCIPGGKQEAGLGKRCSHCSTHDVSSDFWAETPPLAHAGLCRGLGTGLTDAVKRDEKEGRAMSPFGCRDAGMQPANALYPGLLWLSAGYHRRPQIAALALTSSGADCFKHPEAPSALGDRMLKHLLRSQLLYSPALELLWESGFPH